MSDPPGESVSPNAGSKTSRSPVPTIQTDDLGPDDQPTSVPMDGTDPQPAGYNNMIQDEEQLSPSKLSLGSKPSVNSLGSLLSNQSQKSMASIKSVEYAQYSNNHYDLKV
jgi:hypothetical protein